MVCLCLTSLWEYNGPGPLKCRHPLGESLFLKRGKEPALRPCLVGSVWPQNRDPSLSGRRDAAACGGERVKWPPANGRRHRPFCSLRPPHAWPPCNRRKQKTKNLPSKCSLNPETMFGRSPCASSLAAASCSHCRLPHALHRASRFPSTWIYANLRVPKKGGRVSWLPSKPRFTLKRVPFKNTTPLFNMYITSANWLKMGGSLQTRLNNGKHWGGC